MVSYYISDLWEVNKKKQFSVFTPELREQATHPSAIWKPLVSLEAVFQLLSVESYSHQICLAASYFIERGLDWDTRYHCKGMRKKEPDHDIYVNINEFLKKKKETKTFPINSWANSTGPAWRTAHFCDHAVSITCQGIMRQMMVCMRPFLLGSVTPPHFMLFP